VPADYTRIHRLLKILTLIQGEDDWTAERLSDACGVAVRTIYRDMKALEGAGIPYFHDGETKGYRVRRDFFMPPVELTLDESLALVALAEHIGEQEQVPLTAPAGKAIAKVRCQLPASIRQELSDLDGHLKIHLAAAGPHEGIADVYERVRSAIATKRVLSCSYTSVERSLRDGDAAEGGEEEVFEFRPYALLFAQRAWYAVGHHGGRDGVRKLKLNRFTMVKPTDRPYAIPDDFNLDDELGHAWRMIRGDTRYDVELHFDREFAETLADTHWHATQQIDWHDDGSITFRCTVDGLDEIVWWVLSMGPHCEVKQPPELAARVKELAAGIVGRYDGSEEKPGCPGAVTAVAGEGSSRWAAGWTHDRLGRARAAASGSHAADPLVHRPGAGRAT